MPIFQLAVAVGSSRGEKIATKQAEFLALKQESRVAIQLAKIWLEFWLEKRLGIMF